MNRREAMGKALAVIGAGIAVTAPVVAARAEAASPNPKLLDLERRFKAAWKAYNIFYDEHFVPAEKSMFNKLKALEQPDEEKWTDDIRSRYAEIPVGRLGDKSIPVLAEIAAISRRNEARHTTYEAERAKLKAELGPIEAKRDRLLDKADAIARRANRIPANSPADIMVKVRIDRINHLDDWEVFDLLVRDIARLDRLSRKAVQS